MKAPIWAWIVLGALIMFGGLVVIGVLTEVDVRDTSDSLTQTERTAFMDGCTEGEAEWVEFCGCTFDYMDHNLTNGEFRDQAAKVVEDDDYFSSTMDRALDACAYIDIQ